MQLGFYTQPISFIGKRWSFGIFDRNICNIWQKAFIGSCSVRVTIDAKPVGLCGWVGLHNAINQSHMWDAKPDLLFIFICHSQFGQIQLRKLVDMSECNITIWVQVYPLITSTKTAETVCANKDGLNFRCLLSLRTEFKSDSDVSILVVFLFKSIPQHFLRNHWL